MNLTENDLQYRFESKVMKLPLQIWLITKINITLRTNKYLHAPQINSEVPRMRNEQKSL